MYRSHIGLYMNDSKTALTKKTKFECKYKACKAYYSDFLVDKGWTTVLLRRTCKPVPQCKKSKNVKVVTKCNNGKCNSSSWCWKVKSSPISTWLTVQLGFVSISRTWPRIPEPPISRTWPPISRTWQSGCISRTWQFGCKYRAFRPVPRPRSRLRSPLRPLR